jgi:hypothetical protein
VSGKQKPKFKVGQVVMRTIPMSGWSEPLKIANITLHLYGQTGKEEWLYGGDGKEAWESWLRRLTARECNRPPLSR